MARIARTALVALVLGAIAFPASAGAAQKGHSSLRACSPTVALKAHGNKRDAKRPLARIAPNRRSRCYRAGSRRRNVPVAHAAI